MASLSNALAYVRGIRNHKRNDNARPTINEDRKKFCRRSARTAMATARFAKHSAGRVALLESACGAPRRRSHHKGRGRGGSVLRAEDFPKADCSDGNKTAAATFARRGPADAFTEQFGRPDYRRAGTRNVFGRARDFRTRRTYRLAQRIRSAKHCTS
jgi:hypothetical protein